MYRLGLNRIKLLDYSNSAKTRRYTHSWS